MSATTLDHLLTIFTRLDEGLGKKGTTSSLKRALKAESINEILGRCHEHLILCKDKLDKDKLQSLLAKAQHIQCRELASKTSLLTRECHLFGKSDKVKETQRRLSFFIGNLKVKIRNVEFSESCEAMPIHVAKKKFTSHLHEAFEEIQPSDYESFSKPVKKEFDNSKPIPYKYYQLLDSPQLKRMVKELDRSIAGLSPQEQLAKIGQFFSEIPLDLIGEKSAELIEADVKLNLMTIIILLSKEIKPSLLKEDADSYPIYVILDIAFKFIYQPQEDRSDQTEKLKQISNMFPRIIETEQLSREETFVRKLPVESRYLKELENLEKTSTTLRQNVDTLYPKRWFCKNELVLEKRRIFKCRLDSFIEGITAKVAIIKFEEQRQVRIQDRNNRGYLTRFKSLLSEVGSYVWN